MTDYKAIFEAIETTFLNYIGKDRTWAKQVFEGSNDTPFDDARYYSQLVEVIFAAGYPIRDFVQKRNAIVATFPDAKTVHSYTPDQIEAIKQDESIIRHKSKIDSCIKNAKRFLDIIEEHGSFQNYIDKFNPHSSPEALEELRVAIDKFAHLGPVNSRHYLSGIGMPMVKPDRVVCRVMYRLGFAPTPDYTDNATVESAIETAKQFADATGHTMHYIDLIMVNFGRVSLGEEYDEAPSDRGICVLEAPQCNICLARDYCQYYQKGFADGELTVELLLEQAKELNPEERAELISLLQKLDN